MAPRGENIEQGGQRMDLEELERKERREEIKAAIKEATKEWLEDCYKEFGRWTLKSLGAAFIAAILIFILYTHGWRK
jgi:hypothetical protein